MAFDLANLEVQDRDEAEQNVSGGGSGRKSSYEPIAEKWAEIDEGKAIYLSDLTNNDVQNIRNLMYRRFGKKNVIVRASKNSEDPESYDAVVREREGDEYLRNGDTNSSTEDIADEADEPDELDEVFE